MTRSEKIKKLANAIRAYRGSTHNGSWVRSARPAARLNVVRWLGELKLDVTENMLKVDGFKTYDEFHKWLKSL